MLSGQTEGQYLAQVETKHPSLIPYKWISISWSEREKIGSKVDKKKKKILSPPAFSSLPPFLLSFSTMAFSHHHSHHQLDHHHLHQPSSSPTIEQPLRTHLSPPSASIFSFFPQLTPTTTPSSNAS